MTKIQQWKEDIDIITNEVTDTIESQYIFKRLKEIVTKNPKINTNNLFWDHQTANFGASVVLGVTRQVDKRTEVVSLLKLLQDINNNPSVITKKWFVEQYGPEGSLLRTTGESHFIEHFGSKPELDQSIVQEDIKLLISSTDKVAKFRHTRIAHKNASKRLVIDLNFKEVEEALKVIEKLVIKYQLLLNQSGINELMPTITYDWESVFRTPWIEN